MTTKANHDDTIENLEIKLLLEAIYLKYGYDFRQYAQASLKRRIATLLVTSGCKNISEAQHQVLNDPEFFSVVLKMLTITVTEFFRDSPMYLRIRQEIVPYLKTYPEIKIWHAGCATGEEVYSLAILLFEEKLLDRCLIYATDINQEALRKAKEGIFTAESLKAATNNYVAAGGNASLSLYYTEAYNSVLVNKFIKERILFSDHNLVSDSVFGEMNVVFCRNVLIYFDLPLQDRALKLLAASLRSEGFLVLGSKETLAHREVGGDFKLFAPESIYRKRSGRHGL